MLELEKDASQRFSCTRVGRQIGAEDATSLARVHVADDGAGLIVRNDNPEAADVSDIGRNEHWPHAPRYGLEVEPIASFPAPLLRNLAAVGVDDKGVPGADARYVAQHEDAPRGARLTDERVERAGRPTVRDLELEVPTAAEVLTCELERLFTADH